MNHPPFEQGSVDESFHHFRRVQSAAGFKSFEKNDFDNTITQQTTNYNDEMEVMQQHSIVPNEHHDDHRKSHLLSELDFFLNRCESVDSSATTYNPGPINFNNNQYISMLTDRLQHHKHHANKGDYHIRETIQEYLCEGSSHESVHTLTKNYIALATEYKMWDRYRIHRNYTNPCVVCLQYNALVKVFFPCEHRCICESCFLKAKCWKECPLCKEGIRLSLVRF